MEKSEIHNPPVKKNSGKCNYKNHHIRKRVPPRLSKRENDIYINNSTNLQCQVTRCHKLFQEGYSEVVIHGLGAAVATAVNVALILQEKLSHTVDLAVNTSTVDIIDDYAPVHDSEEPFSKVRSNSAVHVKVYRKNWALKNQAVMFFTLREIMSFLGISVFEIWLNIISLTVFTFLLAFKLEDVPLNEQNWWQIFLPLFIADGLNCYFCVIVFIRMYLCGQIKNGLLCTTWSLSVLTLIFVFKFLLCRKLSSQSSLEYSEVVSPIFILLQLFVARACQIH